MALHRYRYRLSLIVIVFVIVIIIVIRSNQKSTFFHPQPPIHQKPTYSNPQRPQPSKNNDTSYLPSWEVVHILFACMLQLSGTIE
jgi:hypothetical protein